jgi:hypothetical protein
LPSPVRAVGCFWAVVSGRATISACELRRGKYVEQVTWRAGTTGTIMAAPVPITLDPADLQP